MSKELWQRDFEKKHGRWPFPTEPRQGFLVPLFKEDSQTGDDGMVVVNGYLFDGRVATNPKISFHGIDQEESCALLQRQIKSRSEEIVYDSFPLEYLKMLTRNDALARMKNVPEWIPPHDLRSFRYLESIEMRFEKLFPNQVVPLFFTHINFVMALVENSKILESPPTLKNFEKIVGQLILSRADISPER